MHQFKRSLVVIVEYATLSKPKHRITVWLLLTLLIIISPYGLLENLSFYKLLGWESAPSIGLTRAYWLILHGKIDDALMMNKLIFLVLVIGIPLLVLDAIRIKEGASTLRMPKKQI